MPQSDPTVSAADVAELRARIEKLIAVLEAHTHPVVVVGEEMLLTQKPIDVITQRSSELELTQELDFENLQERD